MSCLFLCIYLPHCQNRVIPYIWICFSLPNVSSTPGSYQFEPVLVFDNYFTPQHNLIMRYILIFLLKHKYLAFGFLSHFSWKLQLRVISPIHMFFGGHVGWDSSSFPKWVSVPNPEADRCLRPWAQLPTSSSAAAWSPLLSAWATSGGQ